YLSPLSAKLIHRRTTNNCHPGENPWRAIPKKSTAQSTKKEFESLDFLKVKSSVKTQLKVRLKTKTDSQPVPCIYHHDHTGKIDQFLFIKIRCHCIVIFIMNTVLRNSRQGFCPTQCCSLTLGKYRHLRPGSQHIQTLLLLAIRSEERRVGKERSSAWSRHTIRKI